MAVGRASKMEMDKIPLKILPKKVQKDFPTKVHFKKSPLGIYDENAVLSARLSAGLGESLTCSFGFRESFFSSLFMKTISNNKFSGIAVDELNE